MFINPGSIESQRKSCARRRASPVRGSQHIVLSLEAAQTSMAWLIGANRLFRPGYEHQTKIVRRRRIVQMQKIVRPIEMQRGIAIDPMANPLRLFIGGELKR